MKPDRRISRRSFLGAVSGASGLMLAGCVTAPIEEDPYDPPSEPRNVPDGGYGRAPPCADGDSGRHADQPGHGRHCGGPRQRRRRGSGPI
jgi:hypothetical protein